MHVRLRATHYFFRGPCFKIYGYLLIGVMWMPHRPSHFECKSSQCILQSLTSASVALAWPQLAPANIPASPQSLAATLASWDSGPLNANMRPRLLEEHERQCRTGTVKGSMFEVRSAMLQALCSCPRLPGHLPLLGMVKVRWHDHTRSASWPHPACLSGDLAALLKAVQTAARAPGSLRASQHAPRMWQSHAALCALQLAEKFEKLVQKLLGARRCSTWRVTEV